MNRTFHSIFSVLISRTAHRPISVCRLPPARRRRRRSTKHMSFPASFPLLTSRTGDMNRNVCIGTLALLWVTTARAQFCGDCFCIPENECPYQLEPNMDFSAFLADLLEFELENPISLDCNPYKASNDMVCDLTPTPLQDGGACVIEFNQPTSSSFCPTNWTYSLRTFPGSVEEAQSQGLYVTHEGHCGACSSLQDLHVYMEKGGTIGEDSISCGIRGIASVEDGIECYREFGYSESCATIWHYNTLNTQENCLTVCADFFFSSAPNNGPPPLCAIQPCIECDEVNSGPIFKKYAGRTRRTSGLLSSIARTCTELSTIAQTDPCPQESREPPASRGARWKTPVLASSVFLFLSVFVVFWL